MWVDKKYSKVTWVWIILIFGSSSSPFLFISLLKLIIKIVHFLFSFFVLELNFFKDLQFRLIQGWFWSDSLFILLNFTMLWDTIFFIINRNFIVGTVLEFIGFDFWEEKVEWFFLDCSNDSGEFEEFWIQVDEGRELLLLDFKRVDDFIMTSCIDNYEVVMHSTCNFFDLVYVVIVQLLLWLPSINEENVTVFITMFFKQLLRSYLNEVFLIFSLCLGTLSGLLLFWEHVKVSG